MLTFMTPCIFPKYISLTPRERRAWNFSLSRERQPSKIIVQLLLRLKNAIIFLNDCRPD